MATKGRWRTKGPKKRPMLGGTTDEDAAKRARARRRRVLKTHKTQLAANAWAREHRHAA